MGHVMRARLRHRVAAVNHVVNGVSLEPLRQGGVERIKALRAVRLEHPGIFGRLSEVAVGEVENPQHVRAVHPAWCHRRQAVPDASGQSPVKTSTAGPVMNT